MRDARAAHQFEAGEAVSQPCLRQSQQRDGRRGSEIAAMAVAVLRGRGNRRSTAAVMMPRVPSDPMNNCFRS